MSRYRPWVEIGSARGRDLIIKFDEGELDSNLSSYGVNRRNVEMLSILWVALLADTPTDPHNKPNSLFVSFSKQLTRDIFGLIKRYSSLYDLLVNSVRVDQGEVTIDHFIGEFRDTPVFFEYHKFFMTKDPVLFKYLLSFLLFGKKAYFEDPSFNQTAFRGWCEVEQRLAGVSFDDVLLQDLKAICSWILSTFDDEQFLPVHGNGAVSEPGVRDVIDKNSCLWLSQTQIQAFDTADEIVGEHLRDLHGVSDRGERRISRLKFVPKDVGKARSICMEPASLQWLQQGVRLWVEQSIKDTLGDRIPLHRQEQNRELARRGSKLGHIDTIDLSSASDSVHMDLIRSIMPARVLQYLELTRSEYVDCGEEGLVKLIKYAPMGSALCFPIQSLLYSALVLYSSFAWRLGKAAKDGLQLRDDDVIGLYRMCYDPTTTKYRLHPFSIYGDDIICDSRITAILVGILTRLGFVVNDSKSFTGDSAFRESCGGFYLYGSDVTPIRAKFGPVRDTMTISVMASFIDLANRAYSYEYLTLRQHIIRICLYYPIAGYTDRRVERNEILFSSDPTDTFAIFSRNIANRHLRQRAFDPDVPRNDTSYHLQRDEVRSIVPGPVRSRPIPPSEDWYRHIAWWRSRARGSQDTEVATRIPAKSGLRWRWTTRLSE